MSVKIPVPKKLDAPFPVLPKAAPTPTMTPITMEWTSKQGAARFEISFDNRTVTIQRLDKEQPPMSETYTSMHAVRVIYGRLQGKAAKKYLKQLLLAISREQLKADIVRL